MVWRYGALVPVISACFLSAPLARAADAFFMGLGDLPGGDYWSLARAISADGTTVVGQSSSALGHSEAFRWTASTGMVGLGDLPGGVFESGATGVSADGSVIVGTGRTDKGYEAFRWEAGRLAGLGTLPGGAYGSAAYGVSGDGGVVVGASWSSQSASEAFRWEGGYMVGLGDLPGDEVRSRAYATSADGTVVAGVTFSSSYAGFRWQAGAMEGIDLHVLGISPDGSVIVGRGACAQAARWEGGAITLLGDLPGGKFASEAHAAAAYGRVIVGGATSDRGPEAFVWDAAHGMRSLKDVLMNDLGLELGAWRLTVAKAVTPDGLVIVGDGYNPAGDAEAWIARLPEPSVWMLFGWGVLLARRGRRR